MLTREEWTRGPGTPPTVKGLIWYTDRSRAQREIGAGDYGQSSRTVLSISVRKYATVFQAEMYANLTSAYEIRMDIRPVSICSESQVALKTLEVAKTTSPLVQ